MDETVRIGHRSFQVRVETNRYSTDLLAKAFLQLTSSNAVNQPREGSVQADAQDGTTQTISREVYA